MIQPATPSARLNLTQFSIEQIGFVDAKIGGLGFFGKFLKHLILPIVNAVKDAIGLAVQEPIAALVAEEFSKIHLPTPNVSEIMITT